MGWLRLRGQRFQQTGIVKEGQEEVEDLLAGRLPSDVSTQKLGDALQQPPADLREIAELAYRAEEPVAKAKWADVGCAGSLGFALCGTPHQSLGAQVLSQIEEIDLGRAAARSFLQEHIAPLDKSQAPVRRRTR
jgi:hypothetical protein